MKIKLPVTWQMCGTVEVEAESIKEAIEDFNADDHAIPLDDSYVDSSFELTFNDEEEIKIMQ